jgi:replicative superfamily II helicase
LRHYFIGADGELNLVKSGNRLRLCKLASVPEDKRRLLNPIRAALAGHPGSTVLVFVNTRKQTVEAAQFIARFLYCQTPDLPAIAPPTPRLAAARDLIVQRLARTDAGLDQKLAACVRQGVAFHHAGMLLEERKLIEDAARESTISVIAATTTLSAGINIASVSRVIIRDGFRIENDRRRVLIQAAVDAQMAGRAGRGERRDGDVFVLAQTGDDAEVAQLMTLAKQEIADIETHLLRETTADRYVLQCLVAGLLVPATAIEDFAKATFVHFSRKDDSSMEKCMRDIESRLRTLALLDPQADTPTALGRAIAGSSMSIEEGLELKEAIDNLQTNLRLLDEVHLLYLCVPPNAVTAEETPPYDHNVWESLRTDHAEVIERITSFNKRMFERHIIMMMQNGGKRMNKDQMAKHDRELDRFFFACILQQLIAEESVAEIVKKYKVTRGSVQSLQMQAATFAGQSVRFCETTGSRTLGMALNTFRERLNFGVKNELLPLMKLPSCNRVTARLLITNRIPGPLELAELDVETVSRILAQKRGDDRPFTSEIDLATRIIGEASEVARRLMIIEELENMAVANTMRTTFGRR